MNRRVVGHRVRDTGGGWTEASAQVEWRSSSTSGWPWRSSRSARSGYRLGQRPPDEDHPYGHGNLESVAGLFIGATLLATGVFVGIDGVRALVAGPAAPPDAAALAVALATAAVKEALYRYTSAVGTALNSPSLLASARDHRADVGIAVVVAAGVLGARSGVPWLDPVAAIAVGGWIAFLAVAPVRTNFGVLVDESPADVTAAVRAVAAADPDVRRVDLARVHRLGSYAIADVEIAVAAELSLREAHAIAHRVEAAVRGGVAHVREVRVHVNPADGGGAEAEAPEPTEAQAAGRGPSPGSAGT